MGSYAPRLDAPLIGLCGPVGVGKSTLVGALATELGCYGRAEDARANPFFARFLEDRATWGFWSQLAFLMAAVNGASAVRREGGGVLERPAQEMFGVFVAALADEGLIADEQVATLGQVVSASERLVGTPDLLVVLDGSPDLLLARIETREAIGDRSYDLRRMRNLATHYERWRAGLSGAGIDVDTAAHDVRSPTVVEQLAREIRARLDI
jgi:deoxyadenosine/deoxycytidine kinase